MLRSEDAVRYDPGTLDVAGQQTMITDAKVRLCGKEAPSVRIGNVKALRQYVVAKIADCATEEMHMICVNNGCMVLAESCVSCGTVGEVTVPVAKIAQIALLSNATAVFLAHNHPGGTCEPSGADIATTAQIRQALNLFGIRVLDHIIVTNYNGSYSFAQHGDLTV